MHINIKDLSAEIQSLLEMRDNLVVTIEALRLCDDKAALDLVAFLEKHLADLDELIEKLTRGIAEPAEAATDPAWEDLLRSLQVKAPQAPPDDLSGSCTFTLPAEVTSRGPKRS